MPFCLLWSECFEAGILASSTFFGSSKRINAQQNMYSIRKKFPANTNTIRFEKITRIQIRIIFGLKNYPNMNTNNIRFEKIIRIRIRIIFGFKKSPKYEYEYKYSASSIQKIFLYRIIRSPLSTRWKWTGVFYILHNMYFHILEECMTELNSCRFVAAL